MKINYISCHSVLEYDEASLFTEMGHEVFCNGAYLDPKGHASLPRPGIKGATHYPEYEKLARENPKTNLPKELIEPFDLIIVMHTPEVLSGNWSKFRELGKPVIWRSIGQSTEHVERIVSFYKHDGLKVVRYSPMEKYLKGFAGEDAMIRFYKDPQEFSEWSGKEKKVINFTQSLKGRRTFCHYDEILQLLEGFEGKVYGTGNDDLGQLNGGELPYELMKAKMRDSRVFAYGGSWPAPYTLAFIEAFMTGIPMVAIGKYTAERIPGIPYLNFYEVSDFIVNGETGFCSSTISELRDGINQLLNNDQLAQKISANARSKAIELFGKEKIRKEWEDFFASL